MAIKDALLDLDLRYVVRTLTCVTLAVFMREKDALDYLSIVNGKNGDSYAHIIHLS